jgi:hypothetical protein
MPSTGSALIDRQELLPKLFSYNGRVIVFRLLERARELYHRHPGAVAWLEAAAVAFADILVAEGLLAPSERAVFPMSDPPTQAHRAFANP